MDRFFQLILLFIKKLGLKKRNWDEAYTSGNAAWDSGMVSNELKKTLKEIKIEPERALELGCGTGTNSIFLGEQGFEVVGVDGSAVALDYARKKLSRYFEDHGSIPSVQFEQADLPDYKNPQKFDFIFDRGCFHTFSARQRKSYAKMAADALRKNGYYLLLTGNAKEPRCPGPPVLTEDEIRSTFDEDFNIVRIREFRWANAQEKPGAGALGFSCLMKRK